MGKLSHVLYKLSAHWNWDWDWDWDGDWGFAGALGLGLKYGSKVLVFG